MQNIYLHSLGCEKNTVDGEHILAILQKKGFNITNNPEDADIIVINTCAFIEDSKKESIDAIFDHSMYKKYGKCKRLIVSGCMSERYKENFLEMFKEVDSAIGIYDLENILKAVEEDGFHDAEENSSMTAQIMPEINLNPQQSTMYTHYRYFIPENDNDMIYQRIIFAENIIEPIKKEIKVHFRIKKLEVEINSLIRTIQELEKKKKFNDAGVYEYVMAVLTDEKEEQNECNTK